MALNEDEGFSKREHDIFSFLKNNRLSNFSNVTNQLRRER